MLKSNQAILTESLLINLLGISRNWFYENLMSVEEYNDTIKKFIRQNKAREALLAFKAAKASDSPACIIARLKITDPDFKEALSDKIEEKEQDRNIVINIPGLSPSDESNT